MYYKGVYGLPFHDSQLLFPDYYLQERLHVDHDALFVTKFRTPMSKRTIQYTVKKYLDEAGIRNASVRTLRHTMATYHVAQGTDLETIQHTLGLENRDAAQICLALAEKAQRKALQEYAL